MRQLSSTALESMHAEETEIVWLVLLKIDHATFTDPVRLVNNTVDVASNGETYIAFPFEITLPGSTVEEIAPAEIILHDVVREVVPYLRSAQGDITVTVSVILADDPDHVEIGPMEMTLSEADWDQSTITVKLTVEDLLNSRYPPDIMDERTAPGLF